MKRMQYQILTLIITALITLFAALPAQAQFIRYELEVEDAPSGIETNPIDFINNSTFGVLRNSTGAITMIKTSACIKISSKENIPVIVKTDLYEDATSGNNKVEVDIVPKYINNGGKCPVTPEMAERVSSPFDGNRAAFILNNNDKTVRKMEYPESKVISYIVLVAHQKFKKPLVNEEVAESSEETYNGLFSIEIEYL